MDIRVFTKSSPISDGDFEKFYALMELSFPRCERKSREEFEDMCKASELYTIYSAFENGELIGFFTVWQFDNFRFGDHFAVNPNFRNRGIGAFILKHIQSENELPLIIEVEHPNEEMAKRRLGFYLRNGFYQNPFPYLLPPMQEGDEPLPMIILSYPRILEDDEYKTAKALKLLL